MVGVTLSAQVICRHETELNRVGYVQFILGGTAKATYGHSALHIRFAKLPIIDTYESLLPWYDFEILDQAGSQAIFRMTDQPGGSLSIYSPMRPSRFQKGTPDLDAVERSLRFVSMLVYYDPDKDSFLPLRALEWASRLRIERAPDADKPHSFRVMTVSADPPSPLSAEQLRDLVPKLRFEPPGGLAATQYWWSPGSSSTELKLPTPAAQRLLQR